MAELNHDAYRQFARNLIKVLMGAALRVRVEGLENIPAPDEGALLVLGNHVSNYDGPLVIGTFPYKLEFLGPGDFPLLPYQTYALRRYGATFVNRGSTDRSSLRAIIDHMKAGRQLVMFPEGGTWEKSLADVKPGAAYISQVTGARILPVGISGTYMIGDDVRTMSRPIVTVRYGEVMPPVPPSQDRRRRDADLQAASDEIMQRIYDLLLPQDQALYDRWAREQYDLRIHFAVNDGSSAPLRYEGPPLPEMAAVGEFVAKPNLFRPFWLNAGLDMTPFRFPRFYPAADVMAAAAVLRQALTEGDYGEYLAYRLPDAKGKAIMAGLRALEDAAGWAAGQGALVRLLPVVHDPGP